MAQTDVVDPSGFISELQPDRVLDLLMATMQVADSDLAPQIDVSRQTINNRRKGRRAMTIADLEATAKALDVPPQLFMGTPLDAVKWVVEHRPHLFVWQVA